MGLMFIANEYGWLDLLYKKKAKIYPVTTPVEAEFVEEYVPEYDNYSGEWDQGGEDIYMIFKVGDKFYKKEGRISSYGEKSWSGEVTEVKRTTKTIEVYE